MIILTRLTKLERMIDHTRRELAENWTWLMILDAVVGIQSTLHRVEQCERYALQIWLRIVRLSAALCSCLEHSLRKVVLKTGVAHDLRSPLDPLQWFSCLLPGHAHLLVWSHSPDSEFLRASAMPASVRKWKRLKWQTDKPGAWKSRKPLESRSANVIFAHPDSPLYTLSGQMTSCMFL